MKKSNIGLSTAAHLIQLGIEALQKDPAGRLKSGISLVDLAEANRVRRKLLKQISK